MLCKVLVVLYRGIAEPDPCYSLVHAPGILKRRADRSSLTVGVSPTQPYSRAIWRKKAKASPAAQWPHQLVLH